MELYEQVPSRIIFHRPGRDETRLIKRRKSSKRIHEMQPEVSDIPLIWTVVKNPKLKMRNPSGWAVSDFWFRIFSIWRKSDPNSKKSTLLTVLVFAK